MTTQFLSRVEREIKIDSSGRAGPGAYSVPGALSKNLPGFVPFSTSSRRTVPGGDKSVDGPAPGSYNVSENSMKKPGAASAFKSASKRFEDSPNNPEPGPGDYVLRSSFGNKKPVFAKSSRNPDLIPKRSSSPPSIPAKSQAHGYEILSNGGITPQPPTIPGFTGRPGDTVGPGDYDPKIEARYKNIPAAMFGRGSDRSSLEKILTKASSAPGPGYYDTPSPFDLFNHNPNDTDFLVHLNAAKRRQTSSFESKTTRDALMKEIEKKKAMPGPGQYDIPAAIQVKSKPPNLQFFTSSDQRFKEEARSMRITVAPGDYTPVTSDFDQMRLKIMKQKKMASRSDWAQNIAFVSTESRFRDGAYDNEVPPATAYRPKVGLADTLPKPNPRRGAFNTSEERFRQAKPASDYLTREQLTEIELNRELAQYLAKPGGGGHNNDNHHLRESQNSPTRPKYSSAFAPSPDSRLKPIRPPPGPPPGTYDVLPKWDAAKGVAVMAPDAGLSKKKPDPAPGPGQYVVDRGMGGDFRNPKNVMLSTAKREEKLRGIGAPGPGYYNVSGSMVKPSHNILLSDKY